MPRMLWTQREDIGPLARLYSRMAYDETRQIVTLVQSDKTSETWLWDGELWVQVADIGPRNLDGLVWDPTRCLLVGTTSNSVWEWSGTDWTQVSDQATGQGTTVFDDRLKQLLRVNWVADSPCATWAWKDSEWTQIDAKGPPNRSSFELVSDRDRGTVLLIGGVLLVRDPPAGFTSQPVRDTWAWDGKWKALSDMGPSARTGMSVAFDRARSRTIVFGGGTTVNPADPYVNDTWEWDGALWRQVQDMGPSRRWSAAATYDVKRNRMVLFGGSGSNDTLYTDTWEYFDYS